MKLASHSWRQAQRMLLMQSKPSWPWLHQLRTGRQWVHIFISFMLQIWLKFSSHDTLYFVMSGWRANRLQTPADLPPSRSVVSPSIRRPPAARLNYSTLFYFSFLFSLLSILLLCFCGRLQYLPPYKFILSKLYLFPDDST